MYARIILLAALLLVSPQAWAQNNNRGRLPDGRAFRIGTDGYRLVDQIAELQVTNDDLRRQVAALETDLDAKELMLRQCGGGVSKTGGSSEEPPNCNELVSSLYLRVSRLQQQVDQANEGGSALPPASRVACNYQSPENPLWDEINQLKSLVQEREILLTKLQGEQNEALQAIRDKREDSIKRIQSELACDYQSKKNPLHAQVAELQNKLTSQAALVEKQASQIALLKERSDTLAAGQSATRSARARMTREPVRVVSRSIPSVGDVDAVKHEFEKTLADIQSLIFKRKSLYDNLKKGGRSVSINVQRLETRGRVSLDSLRRQVSRLNNPQSATKIRKGLKEIRQILKDDISVLRRLSKRK